MSNTIELYTDGSGYVDGFGGWAYRVLIDGTLLASGYGGGCLTDTFAMELRALLEGLTWLREHLNELPISEQTPYIVWYSDCEGLIAWAAREKAPDKMSWYWHALRDLLQPLRFTSHQVGRETDMANFQVCDMNASSMRLLIKTWDEQTT